MRKRTTDNPSSRPGGNRNGTVWRRWAAACLFVATAWLAAGHSVRAAELVITHTAILNALKEQAFRDGRMDLVAPTRCAHAHLTQPQITIGKGRVVFGARLTGRMGLAAGDTCVGSTGDSIDVVTSGRPYFRDGRIGLEDLRVDQLSNEFYRPLIQSLLYAAVGRAVDIDVRAALRDMLADNRAPFRLDVERLDVSRLVAENNRLEASFDFSLLAK